MGGWRSCATTTSFDRMLCTRDSGWSPRPGVHLGERRGPLLPRRSRRRSPPLRPSPFAREAALRGSQRTLRGDPTRPGSRASQRGALRALRWHGLAMLEFRRRTPDGRAAVPEINPRLWGSLQLAVDAGVDFPAAWLAMLRGEPHSRSYAAHLGVRSRWLLGDVDHLYLALRDAELPRRRNGLLQRRTVLVRFLRSFFDGSPRGSGALGRSETRTRRAPRRWLRP